MLETVRNLSLVRWLFARMCQFALDRGTEYVVAATIPTVNSCKLLRSIGMEVVYTYPPTDADVPVVLPIHAARGYLSRFVAGRRCFGRLWTIVGSFLEDQSAHC